MSQPKLNERRTVALSAWIMVSAAAITIVLIVTLFIVKPAMPDRIILLTGEQNSAYHDLGQRYAEDLRGRGLEVNVMVTHGASDNVKRLKDSGRNVVAFAPSIEDWSKVLGAEPVGLVALGSIGLEPLWLFSRADLEIARVTDLAGKTVVTEGQGSVSDAAVRRLIKINKLTGKVELQPRSGIGLNALMQSFSRKSIDAVFVSGDVNSPLVASLLENDLAKLISLDRARAYAAWIPGVTAIEASEGVFDLARNLPGTDTRQLAATTCLIAHENLHPAVVPMLLATVDRVRKERPANFKSIEFPSEEHVTLPLSRAAQRYFKQGEVGFSKFLPYRTARLLNHLGFFVLPIAGVMIVLLKIVPVGLRKWCAFRLRRLFKQLEVVEKGNAAGEDTAKLLAQLDGIDQASAKMFMSRSNLHDYIDLRQFLHDMRERVEVR